ncbi:cytochrome c biogenesis protein ResB [Streptomyces sp. RFCAC02]|uniref:cytochrome c biogenesis protein ResB n=1 Tax=Streptomyces sp. RFCAC02 TaxID=2499143 RepID=UPI001021EDF7|nr:cytochrome c biogenesis protein ResB [Streptomyces sp. RFCAC02]
MTDDTAPDGTGPGRAADEHDEQGEHGDGPPERDDATGGLSTAPAEDDGTSVPGSFGGTRAPGVLGALAWTGRETLGWARWFWRQLTSMRIALLLLFLLALASVPGSLIPQQNNDELAVRDFRERNPGLADFYDTLQLFHVYSSVWFSAIYLLLFISLVGCILPRTWQFVGQLRSRPARAPRRLDRMPAYTTWRTEAAPDEVLDTAHRLLKRRRFRTDRRDDAAGRAHVAAEKGYLREAGNLLFHLSLVVLLIAFAVGRMFYTEGSKLLVEGSSFVNNVTVLDDFEGGQLYDLNDLERFSFTLDDFRAEFADSGPDIGTPELFEADVSYHEDDGTERHTTIDVNTPLRIGDTRVRLIGHGFAPVVTVTDAEGNVAYRDSVPFLPQDAALTSTGVVKVPDYVGPDGEPDQLGFQGLFNPTYALDEVNGPHSTFPEALDPRLTLNVYHGDLGVNSGLPQNVYQLDTTHLDQLTDDSGEPLRFTLTEGESYELPDGRGTITFEGLEQWATFQVTTRSGNTWALVGALAAVVGLVGSLLLQRRRVWVRAWTGGDGLTVVEMASLGRTESARVPQELAGLADRLAADAPLVPDDPDGDPDGGGPPGDDTDDGGPSDDDTASESAPAEGARR